MSQDLLTALANETNAIVAFGTLLDEEQQALVYGKLDTMPELTDRKTQAVAKLAELGRERDACLRAMGYDTTEAGVAAVTAVNAQVSAAWKSLMVAAADAKRTNETNGMLIRTRLTFTQQALTVLYGPNQTSLLYGPDGRTSQRTSGASVTA
jgi:flagella synthesis protein FlgN